MHYIRRKKGAAMDAPYQSKQQLFKHGMCGTPIYTVWRMMKDRCFNPKSSSYQRYGGCGVRVCERWLTFKNFLADMGDRLEGTSIDRIDNDGHYEPGNCRWATRSEQGRNKRHNRRVTIDGVTRCVSEWAEISGTPHVAICKRLNRGWPEQRAVFLPSKSRRYSNDGSR